VLFNHHSTSRARPAGLSGFFTLIQSRDGSDLYGGSRSISVRTWTLIGGAPCVREWLYTNHARGELRDPHPINEAVETLCDFPKMREMILQLRKPLCDSVEALITACEFRAEISNGLAIIALPDERYC
jgi:hypothetical protein